MLELSGTQPEQIIEQAKHYGLKNVEIIPDLNRINRVLKIKVQK